MRLCFALALGVMGGVVGPLLAHPAQAKGKDGGDYERGYGRGYDRDYGHDNGRRGKDERHEWKEHDGRRQMFYRERERERYGYGRPPAYYPGPPVQYAPPPVYAPPGLNLFVPFR